MGFCDFQVRYDPSKDTQEELTRRILYSIFIKQLKAKKPRVVFISGDSGEGKSWVSLRLQELLLEIQGLKLIDLVKDINVHTPLEYPEKLRTLLFPEKYTKDKERLKILKKANILCVHEARTLIKSKRWQEFTNQAVGDVNAMSRSIKRICFIIISQFIRDITTDVRYTLNFYGKVSRPLGRKARLYLYVMWKDDRDLEKPKLRKRRLMGYLVSPTGKYRKFRPEFFEMSKPDKAITDIFEKSDFESKGMLIHKIMERMIREMRVDANIGSEKVDAMVEWYSKYQDELHRIGKRRKTGWKFKKEIKDMHDLTDIEFTEFESKMNTKLMDLGIMENPEKSEE